MNNLIGVGDAARLRGVSQQTIRKWADSGEIECVRDFAGRRWLNPDELGAGSKIHPQGQPSLKQFPRSIVTLKELIVGSCGKHLDFAKRLGNNSVGHTCELNCGNQLANLKKKLEVLGYDLVIVFFINDAIILMDGKTYSEELCEFFSNVPKDVGRNAYTRVSTFNLKLDTLVKYVSAVEPDYDKASFFIGAISKEDGKRWILCLDNDDTFFP